MAWLTGWNRRKPKMINGSTAGAQANYQMQLTVHKGTGTDTATDIYLGTNVRDDFGDVRFTGSNGSTPLDYWIQSYTSGSVATFWIEIPSIPTGTNSVTIYVYYDNPAQITTSNGTNTFDFFDDFSTDLNKWNNNIGGAASIVSGRLQITAGQTLGLNAIYSKVTFDPRSNRIDLNAQLGTSSGGAYYFGWRIDGTDSNMIYSGAFDTYNASPLGIRVGVAGSYSTGMFTSTRDTGWHNYSLWVSGTTGNLKIDITSYNETDSKYTSFSTAYLGFARNQNDATLLIDDVRVRKYTSPEPTFGCSGGEEVATVSWLTGWNRRRSKIVNGSTASQTNYQMKLTVHRETGADSATDIYLGTNVRTDFGDVRFTKQDGSSLLNYWIESISGNIATFWIQMDSIPENPCTTSIYIYYDNSSQITISNGTNTFDLFDDFSGTTLDATKWASVVGGTGSVSIGGGQLTINSPNGVGNGGKIDSITTFAIPYAYSFRYQLTATPSYKFPAIGISDVGNTFPAAAVPDITGNNAIIVTRWGTGRQTHTSSGGVYTRNDNVLTDDTNFHKVDAIATSSSVNFYQDGILKSTHTTNIPTGSIKFSAKTTTHDAFTDGGTSLNIDYVLVRKYSSPEPTFGSSGTEETPALITATAMIITTSQTPCLQGICTVTVEATWTNQGTATGSFVPSLTIDGAPIVSPYPSEDIGAGASVTHAFDITNLAVGDRTICPSPN